MATCLSPCPQGARAGNAIKPRFNFNELTSPHEAPSCWVGKGCTRVGCKTAAPLAASWLLAVPDASTTPKSFTHSQNHLTPCCQTQQLNIGPAMRTLLARRHSHLKSELTVDQLVALQNDLENIDRAANILPMRHSELFLNLLMHIRFTRTELAARRDAGRDWGHSGHWS